MPALPASVTAFTNKVIADLQGDEITAMARAQDLATVLELLQDGLDTGTLTVTATGTTTSVVDSKFTFTPGQQVGNLVVFASNTTTVALRGVSRRIVSNTDSTLTLDPNNPLPAVPVSTDTYIVRGGMADAAVSELRDGKALGDAPAGSVYGDYRQVLAGLLSFQERLGVTQATGTLTLAGNPANGETVTINGKVYTFQTTLTNVDGNVDIGATASDSIDQLIAAINLGAGSGTAYAAATTLHPTVVASAGAGDTMIVTAKTLMGPAGNVITTTETLATGGSQWAAATLTGGAINSFSGRRVSHPSLATVAGSTTTVIQLTNLGVPFRQDQFKGMMVTVNGSERQVVGNDASSLTVAPALSGAPGGAVAVIITAADRVDGAGTPWTRVHPGGHLEGHRLASLITQVRTLVTNYVLPT